MIEVRYENGVFLPKHDLWLDPQRDQDFAFVSHAHADHIGRHKEVILSANTARLMRARLSGERIEHVLEYNAPEEFRGGTVNLLPAGHIFGSAQFHYKTDDGALLYTGDFKLRQGQSAAARPLSFQSAPTSPPPSPSPLFQSAPRAFARDDPKRPMDFLLTMAFQSAPRAFARDDRTDRR